MRGKAQRSGVLRGAPEVLSALADAGIRTVRDVLGAGRTVRDLPDRSNHVLEVAGATCFVKRAKAARPRDRMPREAQNLERLRAAGVPTASLAFWGVDAEAGAVTGTASLAPARPLDQVLAEGRLGPATRRRLLRTLARTVATLHAASLHHKDLYLNHLYVDAHDPELVVRVIDVERVARHRRALGRWVVKDLAALCHSVPEAAVSTQETTRFLVRYLRVRDLPRRGVLAGLVRRVRAKARRMARHVPRTPVGELGRGGRPAP